MENFDKPDCCDTRNVHIQVWNYENALPNKEANQHESHLNRKQIKMVLLTKSCGCGNKQLREKQRQSEVEEAEKEES